jgi:methyltransferase
MDSRTIFTGIAIAVMVQRLFELRISKRNASQLIAQGGRVYHDNSLFLVKILQIGWFVAMLLEVWRLDRPFMPGLAAIALFATVIGQYLRYLSMQALRLRWTLPIVTLPGVSAVDTGIYHYLRHPNWLGVILEIFAVPLIHSAYLSAIFFSVANAFLLARRVKAEETALKIDNNYEALFKNKSRFILTPTFLKPLVQKASTTHGT